jgi:hypothetical protein
MKHEERNCKDFAQIKKCNSLEELHENYIKCCPEEKFWMFRGQKDARWNLKTTFERLTDIAKPKDIINLEIGLLRKFERELPLYSRRVPKDKDLIELFSLMQHYGTPTRLLDWTYSLYIATYFALEDIEWENERILNCFHPKAETVSESIGK